jgi:hypothetical protein
MLPGHRRGHPRSPRSGTGIHVPALGPELPASLLHPHPSPLSPRTRRAGGWQRGAGRSHSPTGGTGASAGQGSNSAPSPALLHRQTDRPHGAPLDGRLLPLASSLALPLAQLSHSPPARESTSRLHESFRRGLSARPAARRRGNSHGGGPRPLWGPRAALSCPVLPCPAPCCSVLPRTALSCPVLLCPAPCCPVLPRAAWCREPNC